TPELVEEMKQLLIKIAQLNEVTIEQMEVMPEHVHLMISFKPKYAASNVVKALKGASARLFLQNKNSQFWGGHLWSHNYYIGTLGNMSKEVVEKYIQNQYSK
ncbi:MAG: IS200/IS605 family transposase, partial [Selenomonadaceae bacterium]|nr:IS200/IS605 family transposase [Selenomonadaceae bacterium]